MPKLAFIILTISIVLASTSVMAQDPLLQFERVHTRVAGESENRISVTVFADGNAMAAFPPYMKRAGRHAFTLSERQMSDITAMVDTLSGISQEHLDEERARTLTGRSSGMAYEVSDPDTVIFTVTRSDRSQHMLVAPSPDLMRDRQRSDSSLQQLADMETRLRDLAQGAAGGER